MSHIRYQQRKENMKALNLQNRTFGLIENGSWGPVAGKQMKEFLEGMKDMRVLEPIVTVKSALNEESLGRLGSLKEALVESLAR